MKKYIFLIITLFSAITFSYAQSSQDTIVVVPGKQGMYFYHVVTREETIYSLSRRYHLDPKELANFNHLTLKSQLQIFQLVKIPLNKENFDQSSTTNTADYTPLYHKVLKGETLYHISQLHDRVPDALLQKWNGLSGNEVKAGQYIIVGWLKTGDENAMIATNNASAFPIRSLSDTQQNATTNITEAAQPATGETKNLNASNTDNSNNSINNSNSNNSNNTGNSNNSFLNEVIASENTSRNIHTSASPVDIDNDAFAVKLNKPKPVNNNSIPENTLKHIEETKLVSEKKELQKKESIKGSNIILQPQKPEKPDSFDMMLNRVTESTKVNSSYQKQPAISSQTTSAETSQPTQQNSYKQTSQPLTQVDETKVTEPATAVTSEFDQQYEQQTNNGANIDNRKGAAGWFKSNVKPGSGRYYALCNDLPRGTIVKVINPLNEKSILVKVLDVIPKGAENYNLIIKISDAAMGDLGVTQSRFWCEIQFPKQ